MNNVIGGPMQWNDAKELVQDAFESHCKVVRGSI